MGTKGICFMTLEVVGFTVGCMALVFVSGMVFGLWLSK